MNNKQYLTEEEIVEALKNCKNTKEVRGVFDNTSVFIKDKEGFVLNILKYGFAKDFGIGRENSFYNTIFPLLNLKSRDKVFGNEQLVKEIKSNLINETTARVDNYEGDLSEEYFKSCFEFAKERKDIIEYETNKALNKIKTKNDLNDLLK